MGQHVGIHLTKAGHRLMCLRIRDMYGGTVNTLSMGRIIRENFATGLNTYTFDQEEFDSLFGRPTAEEIALIGGDELFADVAMEPQL
ncbi:MAG: hypothetical protein L0H36_00900 [bacterium]|nr:hypothetical protein [bacterium]MDN5835175.1 hypothetical protein [bacterium]